MVDFLRGTPLRPSERSEGWRRVRIGLSGIGVIVLMLAIASAMQSRLDLQVANQPAQSSAGANTKPQPDKEPMADLGVAPGAPEEPANQQ